MENEKYELQFRGVWIPKEVFDLIEDGKVNSEEFVILVQVEAMSSMREGCKTSDKYLAGVLRVDVDRIVKLISGMIEKGYLYNTPDDDGFRNLWTFWQFETRRRMPEWLKEKYYRK